MNLNKYVFLTFLIIGCSILFGFSVYKENQIQLGSVILKQINNKSIELIIPSKEFEVKQDKVYKTVSIYTGFLLEIKNDKNEVSILNEPIYEISGYVEKLKSYGITRKYSCDCKAVNDEKLLINIDNQEYILVVSDSIPGKKSTSKKAFLKIIEMQ